MVPINARSMPSHLGKRLEDLSQQNWTSPQEESIQTPTLEILQFMAQTNHPGRKS